MAALAVVAAVLAAAGPRGIGKPMTQAKSQRLIRHLRSGPSALRKALPESTLQAIEQAIAAIEDQHPGEICFAVEARLPSAAIFNGLSPRARALAVFSDMRIWDTEGNNGVLIYLLLADRAVEILADRAALATASQAEWDAIPAAMRPALVTGDYASALMGAVQTIASFLARQTGAAQRRKELPNTVVLGG